MALLGADNGRGQIACTIPHDVRIETDIKAFNLEAQNELFLILAPKGMASLHPISRNAIDRSHLQDY
jgi:hypothetical protein